MFFTIKASTFTTGRVKGLGLPTALSVCFLFGCRTSLPDDGPVFFVNEIAKADATYDETSFLSLRKDGLLAAPVTMSGETRYALTPPLPSRLSFAIRIPPDPVLRFAIGCNRLGDAGVWPAVQFLIALETGGKEEFLFEEVIRRSRPDQWLDRELDLSPWAGKDVRLTFETRLARTGDRVPWTARRILPLWGNPLLVSTSWRGSRPNIVLISVDCLRPDHMSAYGYDRVTTPRIDQLAEDGFLFETATSTASWTLPGHMSMMTGLPPSLNQASKWEKLQSSIPYLPDLLAANGYEVDGIASWVYVSQLFGFERGFHVYRVLDQPRADHVVDDALDLVRRGQGTNQFLFVHIFDPHWPYLPPPQFMESFAPRPPDISSLDDMISSDIAPTKRSQIQQVVDLYDGEIRFTDREIGRFLDGLKEMGLYDETLVILTADHGEAFWEHGHWEHTKTLYEEIIRVPMIVKWPGDSPSGRCDAQVSLVDLFPTILDSAGIDFAHYDGENLRRRFEACESSSARRHVLSENMWRSPTGIAMKVALRSEQYKYVASLVVPDISNLGDVEIYKEELYNLLDDPEERISISESSPEQAEAFRREVLAYLRRAADHRTGRGETVFLDEATKQKLKSLGYVVQ